MEKVEDLSRRSLIRHRDIVIWEENGWDEKRKKKKRISNDVVTMAER